MRLKVSSVKRRPLCIALKKEDKFYLKSGTVQQVALAQRAIVRLYNVLT